MTEVEEAEMMLGDTAVSDISAFTADVNLQRVYWVDSVSRKMWSSALNDTEHSLVGRCFYVFFLYLLALLSLVSYYLL